MISNMLLWCVWPASFLLLYWRSTSAQFLKEQWDDIYLLYLILLIIYLEFSLFGLVLGHMHDYVLLFYRDRFAASYLCPVLFFLLLFFFSFHVYVLCDIYTPSYLCFLFLLCFLFTLPFSFCVATYSCFL